MQEKLKRIAKMQAAVDEVEKTSTASTPSPSPAPVPGEGIHMHAWCDMLIIYMCCWCGCIPGQLLLAAGTGAHASGGVPRRLPSDTGSLTLSQWVLSSNMHACIMHVVLTDSFMHAYMDRY